MSDTLPALNVSDVNPNWKIGIVSAAWHGELTQKMAEDAKATLINAGIHESCIKMETAAGSFELPLAGKWLIDTQGVDGVIAFGIIVQGETHHAELVAASAAQGLMSLQMATGVPVINEILLVDEKIHAEERAVGPRAKGVLAAQTLLHSLALGKKLHS